MEPVVDCDPDRRSRLDGDFVLDLDFLLSEYDRERCSLGVGVFDLDRDFRLSEWCFLCLCLFLSFFDSSLSGAGGGESGRGGGEADCSGAGIGGNGGGDGSFGWGGGSTGRGGGVANDLLANECLGLYKSSVS